MRKTAVSVATIARLVSHLRPRLERQLAARQEKPEGRHRRENSEKQQQPDCRFVHG
ncbi:MAG: hypothetical protein HPM95_04140 [Alphaproteobacteria bacterium]|nr:hypothetical protein [Alphaproteobacteria bacterium]